jgi:hypothetical protein
MPVRVVSEVRAAEALAKERAVPVRLESPARVAVESAAMRREERAARVRPQAGKEALETHRGEAASRATEWEATVAACREHRQRAAAPGHLQTPKSVRTPNPHRWPTVRLRV